MADVGRYLSIPILGLAAALSAGVMPHMIGFAVAVLSDLTPILEHTRGQLNLGLLLVMTWAIRASLTESLIWAFAGGIFMDLLSILPLGTSSFALVLIAFAVSAVSHQLYRVRLISLLLMTILSTIFFQFFTYQMLTLLGHSYHLPSLVRLVMLPTLVYHLVMVLPVAGLVRLMQSRLEGGLQRAPNVLPGTGESL